MQSTQLSVVIIALGVALALAVLVWRGRLRPSSPAEAVQPLECRRPGMKCCRSARSPRPAKPSLTTRHRLGFAKTNRS
jgi:hypothetical protein